MDDERDMTASEEDSPIPVRKKAPDTSINVSPQHQTNSSQKHKSEQRFGRFTEKASKFLPKKETFGKLFSDKDTSVTIYTIDKEMNKAKKDKVNKGRVVEHEREESYGDYENRDKFHNPELSEKLRRTKQNLSDHSSKFKSIGVTASDFPPYRLFFLPPDDWRDSDSKLSIVLKALFCQCSLACFILLWIVFGALTFYLTEGPYEYSQNTLLQKKQNSVVVSLMTDIRLLGTVEDFDDENVTLDNSQLRDTIEKHLQLHESLVVDLSMRGYSVNQTIWTFPGSILYATSLLTTLGLATPTPLTMTGKVTAVIYCLFGLPLHLIFIINLGKLIAIKMQLAAKEIQNKFSEVKRKIHNVRKFGEDVKSERETWPEGMFNIEFRPPLWLRFFPIFSFTCYYLLGFLLLGLAREMTFPELLLFPLDFSHPDPNSVTNGFARMGYAWYLEGLALLFSINLALLRDSSFPSLTAIGINLGLMTNSME